MNDNEKIGKSLYKQAIDNWIVPEIAKRKNKGLVKPDFKLRAGQIIFTMNGSTVVRLNSEVRILLEVKPKRKIEKNEEVLVNDIDEIKAFHLLDEEKRFGHITIVEIGNKWAVGFNFDYDVSMVRAIYSIAAEFVTTANLELRQKRFRSFIESAFIAAENIGKAKILFSLPDKEVQNAKKHGTIAGKINIYARDNKLIKSKFAIIFNRLNELRDPARYNISFTLDESEANKIVESINDLSKEVGLLLARFAKYSKTE